MLYQPKSFGGNVLQTWTAGMDVPDTVKQKQKKISSNIKVKVNVFVFIIICIFHAVFPNFFRFRSLLFVPN